MSDPSFAPDEAFLTDESGHAMLLDTPLEERFERITRLACRLLNAPMAAISLVAADRQWFTCSQDFSAPEVARSVAHWSHALGGEELLVVNDARRDARFADHPMVTGEPGIRFYAACPLRSTEGGVLGTLFLVHRKAIQLTEDDVNCFRDLASLAQSELATAMQAALRADLMDQIGSEQRRAMVDPLTRLWNRDAVLEAMEEECAPMHRASACAAIMADLDFFKKVNDEHGHAVGDEVLRETAKRILKAVRDTDSVGRYGGEEFLISLGPVADERDAFGVAETIRQRVCESPVVTKAGEVRITMTLGVSFAPQGCPRTPEMLIEAADRALYDGKRNGRNRVESVVCESRVRAAA